MFNQICRFGIVGVICFLIDFGTYTLLTMLGCHYLIAGIFGFTISVICNYILSMKYVFKSSGQYSKRSEFAIYVVLSVIGLGLNEVLLWLFVDRVYADSDFLQSTISKDMTEIFAKVIAVGIVMVYNFVSRKLILERPKEGELA